MPGEALRKSTPHRVNSGPDSRIETDLRRAGFRFVAGVDEAGRGALAGSLFAAAVVLDMDNVPAGLNDSKKLTAGKRERLDRSIRESADVSVALASREEVDRLNVLHAAMLAMRRAVEGLLCPPDHLLIDGNRSPDGLRCPVQCVVSGDAKSISIAAASIVAKVARDRHMSELDGLHPEYGWSRNCGYGTRLHLDALGRLGPTPWHRRSFRPVQEALEPRLFPEARGGA